MEIFGDFGMAGAFDTTANPYQDRQVCINFYPELSPSKAAKVGVSLLGCPGLKSLVSASGGALPTLSAKWDQPYSGPQLPVRGFWVLPGETQALAVVANTVYLVTYSQPILTSFPVISMNKVGTVNTTAGPVCIRDNNVGGYAVIVDGPCGYLYNIKTQTVAQITDPAFLGANTVCFIDGWWVFNQPGTQVFYTNASQYSTAFSGSSFALKDSYSDNLMAVYESKEELWLPGEQTTEIWYDAGGQYFPFQRLVGTLVQVGCKAAHSISRISVQGQDGLIWFGRSDRGENVIVQTQGFAVQTVSTPAVSDAIAKYSYTADAVGYTYQEDAHSFYVLTFPTADKTWVYDATMPPDLAWTQRLSYDPYQQQFHRHRSSCIMNFAQMRIVGDYQNGVLYQLTRDAYSDAGWPLLARRRAPHIWSAEDRRRVFMASLQADFAPGVGNQTGIGVNPTASLKISRDGGQTYGNPNKASLGAVGQFTNRAIWRRLGFGRDNVVELDVIDPVKRDLTGATLRAASEP